MKTVSSPVPAVIHSLRYKYQVNTTSLLHWRRAPPVVPGDDVTVSGKKWIT